MNNAQLIRHLSQSDFHLSCHLYNFLADFINKSYYYLGNYNYNFFNGSFFNHHFKAPAITQKIKKTAKLNSNPIE